MNRIRHFVYKELMVPDTLRKGYMNEIFTRTSIRQFEERAVEKEKIEKLLKAAMQAPTADNQQPWVFYVVRNKEVLEQLAGVSPYAGPVKSAPMAIVVGYKDEMRFPELGEVDCAIAVENIWLEAEALGLGAVMLAVAPLKERMTPTEKILQMPENVHAFAIVPVGYAKKKNTQQSRYDERKVFFVD